MNVLSNPENNVRGHYCLRDLKGIASRSETKLRCFKHTRTYRRVTLPLESEILCYCLQNLSPFCLQTLLGAVKVMGANFPSYLSLTDKTLNTTRY